MLTTRYTKLLVAILTTTISSGCAALPVTKSNQTSCNLGIEASYPQSDISISNHNDFTKKHYVERIKSFRASPLQCAGIVMIGDSHIEMNSWQHLFKNGLIVSNRGIKGDTSDGVLARLQEVEIRAPKAVFLMIGTNDLWTSNAPSDTAHNIALIVQKIKQASPETLVFVHTVLPLANDKTLNRKVRQINQHLLIQSNQSEPFFKFELLDTFALFIDVNESLDSNYTNDGVHLNELGYKKWEEFLFLQSKKLDTPHS
jgi:lysophospholipase L1-like esterase